MNMNETLSDFDDENKTRLSYDSLHCSNSYDLSMNKDDEDSEMNVNPNEDSQVMQIDLMEKTTIEYESNK